MYTQTILYLCFVYIYRFRIRAEFGVRYNYLIVGAVIIKNNFDRYKYVRKTAIFSSIFYAIY